MYHVDFLVTISTNVDGVHVAKTSISATDKFKRNILVELRKTFDVKITIMTIRLPKRPTAKTTEHKKRLVKAM